VLICSILYASKLPALCRDDRGWMSYLLLFALLPLVFFTFARNIIYPYVFPSLPAFALAFAELAKRSRQSNRLSAWFVILAGIMGVMLLLTTVVFISKPQWIAKSQKPVVAAWQQQHPAAGTHLIYWADKAPFSAQFYSRGQAKATLDQTSLCQWASSAAPVYLVFNARMSSPFPESMQAQMTVVASVQVLKDTLLLYRVNGC